MARAALALALEDFASLPPPRLTFVPLGFAPELRRSPWRLPGLASDLFREAFRFFEILPIPFVFLLLDVKLFFSSLALNSKRIAARARPCLASVEPTIRASFPADTIFLGCTNYRHSSIPSSA
ncbi:MAG: hypothetical protein H0X04_04110 [Chthoniobacterales bacterium]|nr:hypothetical protein [Chthoniobacterales bacterium]